MGKLVSSAVLLLIAFSLLLAAATLRSQRPGPVVNLLRLAGYVVAAIALAVGAGARLVVIDPGQVGVRHAFGSTDPTPLLAGIRFVPPWSSIERYSSRPVRWRRRSTPRSPRSSRSRPSGTASRWRDSKPNSSGS